ncbi:DegT/DnrJ/EryC1/StrS family aminotransferase [Pseudonocardia sp. H11422]|uniref:DegT/DnrJ/EryC1/StrS family aminotransferase n=1 Tax=Pseudonocardia sp. H11422 TaxID=2835866 RepID=UPI001BDBDE2E|nr:DegT/DnrJ/EryC1/StrS family aminotransferase [Pseudonocardia sp. H11422]
MSPYAARSEFLPFALPTIEDSDVEEVVDVIRSGWLTSGPGIQKFEHEIAAEVNAPAALAVSSGTAAMHVALTALRVAPGTAVITTPMTFCSTAHVIEQVGCRPLFVDVEPATLNLDPAAVRRVLSQRRDEIGAILPVHYAGHPCELDQILDLGRRHGIPVVEDAAHAFGAAFRGVPIGEIASSDHSRAVCFSLYATKNITSGEGGVLSGAPDMVAQARLWSLHGMNRDSWQRYGPRGSWDYEVLVPGFKCNMSDIQAALGRAQLRRWRALQQRRTAIAARYDELLADLDEIETPTSRPHVTHAWHLYPIRLRLQTLVIDRATFIDELRQRNVGTSVHFIPLHLQPYYKQRYGFDRNDFPVAAGEFDRLISLPIYPRMTDADVDDVVAAVRDVVRTNRWRS